MLLCFLVGQSQRHVLQIKMTVYTLTLKKKKKLPAMILMYHVIRVDSKCAWIHMDPRPALTEWDPSQPDQNAIWTLPDLHSRLGLGY